VTQLLVSPRHGDGGRTDGAGCRDTGGVGLGGSVTMASHDGHGRSSTGCWTHGGSLIWVGFSRARSAHVDQRHGVELGMQRAHSNSAATRRARFDGEAGRGCYGARRSVLRAARGGETRASGPAQPSLGRGERTARRRAVERGKKKRAHLGEAPRGAAQRVRRRWRRSRRGAAPTADRRGGE
jgi:hypothetical protein